jgi:undecaprenyl diphosphate synthase
METTDLDNPKSIGIIMDGNRRWAKNQGKPSFDGHSKGYEVFKEFLNWAKEAGIKTVYSYVFSEENWKRKEDEVSFLISLIRKIVDEELDNFMKENTRLKFAGNIEKFPKDIYEKMIEIEEKTKNNEDSNLILCMSYSGREELVYAFNRILKNNPDKKEITKEDISNNLYTAGFPDPDLIIRTSGEKRVSSFLSFQSTYSELFFTETLWPDFNKEEFLGILEEYKKRERRIGK